MRIQKLMIIMSTVLGLLFLVNACKPKAKDSAPAALYTCPMPQDSVFSDKPGNCPKCGMALVQVAGGSSQVADNPNPKTPNPNPSSQVELEALIRPTNEFVVSSIPVVTMEKRQEQIEIEALGNIMYDTRQVGSISSRVAGRIEKLYVRYRYQKISKGQKIMDVYSPEMVTAQQDLLFLLKNDPENLAMISAAKDKLLLLGMSSAQLQEVMRTGKAAMSIAVYSNYSGHIHESTGASMQSQPGQMRDIARITEELSLKEGMYLQKGQSVFTVFNPARVWVVLNIYGDNQGSVKTGDRVRVIPETAPDKDFRARIDFIEPFYRKDSKTLTARVYFDNSTMNIPVGSQVRATIFGDTKDAQWLPKGAVLSLGMDRVVFIKGDGGFRAHKITTGITHEKHIQVTDGLSAVDSVAANAQYLIDSESFIKVK